MSALARWFNANKFNVVGYDKTTTELTDSLLSEGIIVHFEDSKDNIPADFMANNTLVIYTPAIPASHSQYNYFVNAGYEVKKRAEVLGMISSTMFTVAIAGTHGKTTTSSMIAHLLKSSGVDTTAFLGGIATNYNSNLVLGKSTDAIAVIEADEYDKSFLQLSPDIEVITSVDADHLDIYGDEEQMQSTYKQFYSRLKPDGQCIIASGAQKSMQLSQVDVYGDGESITADNLIIVEGKYRFDYVNGTHRIEDIQLSLPGNHNTENALAAITVATALGVSDANIKLGFDTYKGVKRRFEYIIETPDFTFIDDYAHHPAEIEAFISTLKALYPEKFIQVIFQPHLFSRTQDFANEFSISLSKADSVILMDIYPARELPIKGVTSEILFDKITSEDKAILNTDEILKLLDDKKPEVLATIGAGNIDALVPQIKELITKTMVI